MNNEPTSQNNPLAFIKEVAKYFMDFLETDFHKRKNPKRNVQLRNNSNLLVGLNLNKYPVFNAIAWKAINHAFDKSVLNTIQKGVYRTNIPQNLLDLVKLQIGKVSEEQINKITEKIAEESEKATTLYKNELDQAILYSLEESSKIVRKDLVLPFVSQIEKPLENMNLGDENNIYLMEEELTSILVSLFENKISELAKLVLAKENVSFKKQLSEVFTVQDVRTNIASFFEGFKVDDLFADIYELERNKTILDKQEFYLYFCDISYEKAKYPIFYIPFSLIKQDNSLLIEFDSQVYINKKALEYISQEYNREKGKRGNLETITERIIYLAQHENTFNQLIIKILDEITNFFELDKKIEITNPSQQISKSFLVRVSNTCYISLFDKSDEALVNDYEEILRLLLEKDNILVGAFNKLIEDFIHIDPKSFNPLIENEWDERETADKLVFSSPIPLNSEQLQILSAVRNDDCKYIIVEGPPGTGKSHTITAIAFDSILKKKSVLVVSDKKEALDVVEDKITETMNKVRYDKNFQNPILRLGKIGNTYNQILATSSLEGIKTHFRAFKKDHEKIEADIEKRKNSLKEDLAAEIFAYKDIDFKEIVELIDLENFHMEGSFLIDIEEVLKQPESVTELVEIRKIFLSLKANLNSNQKDNERLSRIISLLGLTTDKIATVLEFQNLLQFIASLSLILKKLKELCGNDLSKLSIFINFKDENQKKFDEFIDTYEKEKDWIFGYIFKKNKIQKLDQKFKEEFKLTVLTNPHKHLSDFKTLSKIFTLANELKSELPREFKFKFDYLEFIHNVAKDDPTIVLLNEFPKLNEDIKFLNSNLIKYAKSLKKLGISPSSFKSFLDNKLTEISDLDFDRLIRLINLRQTLNKKFETIPNLNYAGQVKLIEDLVTSQMTYLLDGRLIDFYNNSKATARALRDIIRSKQRFPKEEFLKLKEAFPCILAGIRDYAEFIPLEPEIFDLVIIDEASQVSIAQAFPALLRAKKVLILGDKKQFSNVKSAQARSDTNREYLNHLKQSFIKNVASEGTKLVKLEKFNIKTSILEFFEFISNYNTQLLKHFRGYKENISYSNKIFYQDNLQAMKIRGKKIDDVIKFSFIKRDGKKELIQNSNIPEAEFIILELQKLKNIKSSESVGIITPHTNQQKLLVEMISMLPDKDYFYDNFLHSRIKCNIN